MNKIEIYLDSKCVGNPGPMVLRAVLRDHQEILRGVINLKSRIGTNFEAELLSASRALSLMWELESALKPDKIVVYSSLQLIIDHYNGRARIKKIHLSVIINKINRTLRLLSCPVEFEWVASSKKPLGYLNWAFSPPKIDTIDHEWNPQLVFGTIPE